MNVKGELETSTDGYESPEDAAMEGFPPQHCRVVASREHEDQAYVLLDTGPKDRPYLYGADCVRIEGRWFERSSGNSCGWSGNGDDEETGVLSFWDDVPADVDAVRVEFQGQTLEEPVVARAFLLVWWKVPAALEWPKLVGYRRQGQWTPPPARYLFWPPPPPFPDIP